MSIICPPSPISSLPLWEGGYGELQSLYWLKQCIIPQLYRRSDPADFKNYRSAYYWTLGNRLALGHVMDTIIGLPHTRNASGRMVFQDLATAYQVRQLMLTLLPIEWINLTAMVVNCVCDLKDQSPHHTGIIHILHTTGYICINLGKIKI